MITDGTDPNDDSDDFTDSDGDGCSDAAEEAMHYYIETIPGKIEGILELAEREHGVTIVTLPDEEYRKILEAAAPILDTAAARSPRSAEIIRLMKEYLAEKGTTGTND